jgi:hypothetical protein
MDLRRRRGRERDTVPGRVVARRAVFGTVPAWPEKQTVGPGLGRQFGTTPSPARH